MVFIDYPGIRYSLFENVFLEEGWIPREKFFRDDRDDGKVLLAKMRPGYAQKTAGPSIFNASSIAHMVCFVKVFLSFN